MPMPRSKPSSRTYMTTAMPITAAQISGRYHSMVSLPSALQCFAAGVLRGSNRARRELPGFRRDLTRAVRNQPVDVVNAEPEHDAIGQYEKSQRAGNGRARDGRCRVRGAHDSLYDPRLASALGHDPARYHRDEANPPGMCHYVQIPARLEQRATPPQERTEQGSGDHEKSDRQHDAEGKEDDLHGRPIRSRHAA